MTPKIKFSYHITCGYIVINNCKIPIRKIFYFEENDVNILSTTIRNLMYVIVCKWNNKKQL